VASQGQLERVGIEGTGTYGAALTRQLRAAGVQVVEVDRRSADTAYLATGTAFPDALAAVPAILDGAPLLLVAPDALPPTIADELARLGPDRLVGLGGNDAISDVVDAARSAATAGAG